MRRLLLVLLKKGSLIVLMFVMFVSMMNFTSGFKQMVDQQQLVADIERSIHDYKAIMGVDNSRRLALEKVFGIINKYNRKLSEEEKNSIANEIYEMSVKYTNLDVDLICATITHESARTWNANVVSRAGALGLMQVMPQTGYVLGKLEGIEWTTAEETLFDPIKNIRLGCRYLSLLIDMYEVDGGLAAYNGGERRAAKWLASGRDDEVLYKETRQYIPAILKLYDNYRN